MADIKDRAREYLAKHSEYSEVFGQTFVAVDTLTAMVDFAEQETKGCEAQIENLKSVVISERDEALRVEDVITYTVLNGIIDKWEIKEK